MGAKGDITKASNSGFTPMLIACYEGHLSVCKWLFEVGADITNADKFHGRTPMTMACSGSHLSVCQWLFEVGAKGDITKADNDGATPMAIAFEFENLTICKWLVFNGTLNDPTTQHVDQAIVNRDIPQHRPALLAWAREDILAVHDTFLKVVLRASVLVPLSQQHVSPDGQCRLPLLQRGVLDRVGSFLGVETGRRLRNARELGLLF